MPVDAVEQLRALNARLKRNDEVKALALKLARKAFSSWRGRKVYNFWQDAEHVRGLWRRTTLAGRRPTVFRPRASA